MILVFYIEEAIAMPEALPMPEALEGIGIHSCAPH